VILVADSDSFSSKGLDVAAGAVGVLGLSLSIGGTMATAQLDIQSLTADERIRLAEELWDSLSPADVPLTPAQARELDRRVAAYRADGDPGEPWRDAMDRLAGRRSAR